MFRHTRRGFAPLKRLTAKALQAYDFHSTQLYSITTADISAKFKELAKKYHPDSGTPFASNTRFQELAEYRDHLIEIATQPTSANSDSPSDPTRTYSTYQQQPDPERSRGPKVKPLRPKFSAPPPPSGTASAASPRRKPPPDPSQAQPTDAAAARAAAAARSSKVPRPPPPGATRAAGASATPGSATPRPSAVASRIQFGTLVRRLWEVAKVSTEADTLQLEGGGTAQRQVYTLHGTDKASVTCVRYVFDTDTEAEKVPVAAAKGMVYATCFAADNGEQVLRDAVVVGEEWRAALVQWKARYDELRRAEKGDEAQALYEEFHAGFKAEMEACSDRAAAASGFDRARVAEAHRVHCAQEQEQERHLLHRPISEFKRRVHEHVERERLKNVSRAYSPGGHAAGA